MSTFKVEGQVNTTLQEEMAIDINIYGVVLYSHHINQHLDNKFKYL
jgi:hypothetical protein